MKYTHWDRLNAMIPDYPAKVDLNPFYLEYFGTWTGDLTVGTRCDGILLIFKSITYGKGFIIVEALKRDDGGIEHIYTKRADRIFETERMEGAL